MVHIWVPAYLYCKNILKSMIFLGLSMYVLDSMTLVMELQYYILGIQTEMILAKSDQTYKEIYV